MGAHQEFQWAKRIADGPVRVTREVDLKMSEAGFHLSVMATRALDSFRSHHSTRFALPRILINLFGNENLSLGSTELRREPKRAKREMKPRQ
jgi:hypothetical protein